MALTVTADPPSGYPTKLTIVSDRRVTDAVPEQVEAATITVTTADEERVYRASRVVVPGQERRVAPITITDTRGITWRSTSDDGVTAVYVPA